MAFDRQKAFDTACVALLRQGHRALSVTGQCAYRGAGGSRCAVGWLIPDECYDPAFDADGGVAINGSDAKSKRLQAALGITEDDAYFLAGLQHAHDGSASDFVSRFTESARRVASKYGLNTSVLDVVQSAKSDWAALTAYMPDGLDALVEEFAE